MHLHHFKEETYKAYAYLLQRIWVAFSVRECNCNAEQHCSQLLRQIHQLK